MAVSVRDDVTFRSTVLPPTPSSVPAARNFTAAALRQLDVPAPEDVAVLLVSEVATNAVVHAGSPMRLTVWCNRGRPRVEVRDDDPTLPRRRTPDPFVPGSRGMLLVDALSSEWGVNRNHLGKTVWFEL